MLSSVNLNSVVKEFHVVTKENNDEVSAMTNMFLTEHEVSFRIKYKNNAKT